MRKRRHTETSDAEEELPAKKAKVDRDGEAGHSIPNAVDDADRVRSCALRGDGQPPLVCNRSELYEFRLSRDLPVVAHVVDLTVHTWHAQRGMIQKESRLGHNGYHYVSITQNGFTHDLPLHRVLFAAILGVPYDSLEGFDVDHRDGVRGNNQLENLQLLTRPAHVRATAQRNPHAWKKAAERTGMRVEQLDEDGNVLAVFASTADAGRQTGVSHRSISQAIKTGGRTGVHRSTGNSAAVYRWRGEYTYKPKLQKLIAAVKWWKPLRLPNGELMPGREISDNQLMRCRNGRITWGQPVSDGSYYMFGFSNGVQALAHRCLLATVLGRPLSTFVLHNNDIRELGQFTVDDLREGTLTENNAESGGKPLTVANADGVVSSFPSISAAAEKYGLKGRSLSKALARNGGVTQVPALPGVVFCQVLL